MKSIPRSKRRAALAGAATVCLSVVLFFKLSPTGEAVSEVALLPLLSATKTATLQTDNGGSSLRRHMDRVELAEAARSVRRPEPEPYPYPVRLSRQARIARSALM